ncbi:GspH/FimT family pseudopilin [Burkholderia seminalis]|uniref:Type II secretion system protein H n=1 Tax=Burkholderia cenocepacia TaxID=95486 RepID=A0A071MGI3_9BURK|nr:GspH/FimT family pseudopilin [Burkholderia seminalis]KVF50264.1 pilus assembly protein FimT [Burkholderia seminalis]MBJ9594452.1 GspH/FimT family pseudopilin [Burkholderia seminalis]QTO19405.1 GspH/FimT family pseudopilin [Burkholderia seminalis]RQS99757.1 prepilin-type N-terminal cleavage/methylation domain-containing protein [Burkholderia seminalis]
MELRAHPFKSSARLAGGFTLVELMVALSLAAGLALYAAPAFDQWRMRERVDARSRALLGALSFARTEATRLGTRVTLCRAGNDGTCLRAGEQGDAAEWSCDWIVSGQVDGQSRVLRRYPRDAEVVVAGAAHDLAFAPPAGQAIGGIRRFELRPRRGVSDAEDARVSRCVRIAAGGRARVVAGRCGSA